MHLILIFIAIIAIMCTFGPLQSDGVLSGGVLSWILSGSTCSTISLTKIIFFMNEHYAQTVY